MKHYLEFLLFQGFRFFLKKKPEVIPWLSRILGRWLSMVGIRKTVAVQNLSMARFPLEYVLPDLYANFTRTFLEFLTLESFEAPVHVRAPEDFEKDLAKGGIILSAHTGNWEYLGKYLARIVPLTVVVHRQTNPHVDKAISEIRKKCNMEAIYDDDIRGLLRAITQKRAIALVADQDFGRNSIPVTFFGRPCYAPSGPEHLAKKFNLSVFLCLNSRRDNGFDFTFERLKVGNNFSQAYSDRIEQFIRKNPSQWMWFHNRWKTKEDSLNRCKHSKE